MSHQNFKLDIDGDGIALVTWDMPDRSMNVIDPGVIAELSAIVEKVAGDAAVKGAVVTSGKDAFCAGADLALLEQFAKMADELTRAQDEVAAAAYVFTESRKLSQLYRRLETSGKPWVAAINGTAMGGGFELCLACHHRIAADNPKTRLGLPEIKVGLFPGAGGTQSCGSTAPRGSSSWTRWCRRASWSRPPRTGSRAAARPRRRGTWTASGCPAARSIRRPA